MVIFLEDIMAVLMCDLKEVMDLRVEVVDEAECVLCGGMFEALWRWGVTW